MTGSLKWQVIRGKKPGETVGLTVLAPRRPCQPGPVLEAFGHGPAAFAGDPA
jgi:hypothetical protein